ncbi:hypothetical protein V7061_27995 [Priestia megaterium]
MDLDMELKRIEDSIDKYAIDFSTVNYLEMPIKLYYYELQDYQKLLHKLYMERASIKNYEEKKRFLDKYKKVYLSQKKMYQCILKNLKSGEAKILYPMELEKNIYEMLQERFQFDKTKYLDENLVTYMKAIVERKIHHSNQELFKLKNYPADYLNTFSTYIAPNSVFRYRSELVNYRDVMIAPTDTNSYSIFYNEKTLDSTKNALLNILSFLNGQPSFYCTENYDFNRKLADLYDQFDLLDMLRLRKKNFFDSKQKEPFYLELPILKQKNGYDMVCFEESKHEMIFELYHASLKQFESLPRCVFLYRVFEYGSMKHYQQLFKPSHYKPEDALNYYVKEVMEHRYIPLYYADLGTYLNREETRFIKKRKAKYINFTTKLKEEAKKIINEWSKHPYLKNKSIGTIIYSTGRNAAAHGGGGRSNARYDYSMNYKHINDVNILLELIARYVIESLNPQLTGIVERRTKYYIQSNSHKYFEEQKKD